MAEQVAPHEIYGRLKEGAHMAGYTLERATTHLEWLLEGDRWTLSGQYGDVNEFLASIKFDHFRIVTEKRTRIAERIKELQPEASGRAIAGVLGVDEGTLRKAKRAENSAASDDGANENNNSLIRAAENSAPRTSDVSGAAAAQKLGQIAATRGTLGSGENEWYTPAEWLERARQVLGRFDLDPASSAYAQPRVKAKHFFSLENDGLSQPWRGRVWMNPPYAQPAIAQFADKLVEEVAGGRTTAAIALTHKYTDTHWFHRLAAKASAICFPEGRIRFVAPDGTLASPTQGQAFFYFGDDLDLFRAKFGDTGAVLRGS